MQLTIELFTDGLVDVDAVKVFELHTFCQENNIPVECKGGKKKSVMLNEIVDYIEKQSGEVIDRIEPEPVIEEPEPEQKEPEFRENGEAVRLAKDGKDYGSNCVNRIRSR